MEDSPPSPPPPPPPSLPSPSPPSPHPPSLPTNVNNVNKNKKSYIQVKPDVKLIKPKVTAGNKRKNRHDLNFRHADKKRKNLSGNVTPYNSKGSQKKFPFKDWYH